MAGFGPPAVDFYSMLSGLGDTIAAGQKERAKREAFAQATTPGPDGTVDYGKAILGLAQVDPQSASLLAQRQNHADALKAQEVAAARQAARDKVTDSHWASSFELQKRAAARADEGPVEQAGYRAQVAQKYGIDPNTPEGRAFVVSGKFPETLAGGGEVASANQRAAVARQYGIEPGSPEGKAFILTGKLPDSVANGGRPEVGLQPIYGVGADGKPAIVQLSKTGDSVQTKLPQDFTISREPIKIDNGTHYTLLDPQTRQVVGTLPKNVAAAEAEKEKGSAKGLAEVALPQVLANSDQILKVIEQVQNHPGKQYGLGLWSKAPTIPGTPQADFRAAAAQLKGQTFLQAYQSLKGGGAITDIEGTKGENALARMDQAQSQKAYDEALNDFKQVIRGGMDRAKSKASGTNAVPSSTANMTTSGVKWSVE